MNMKMVSEIDVRPAVMDDIGSIARIHFDVSLKTYKGILPDAYLATKSYSQRENGWQKRLSSRAVHDEIILVAETASHEILGFIAGAKERTNNPVFKGEVYNLYILDICKKKGVGRKLFLEFVKKLLERDISTMLVWALEKNPACGFYEHLGGKKVSTRIANFGTATLVENCYGWENLHILAKNNGSD